MSALDNDRSCENVDAAQCTQLGAGPLVVDAGELIAARRTLPHEVARIGGQVRAIDPATPEDASGLLRIVDEQSRDLVKLRRALIGAMSLADSRLDVIRAYSSELDKLHGELTRVHNVLSSELSRVHNVLSSELSRVHNVLSSELSRVHNILNRVLRSRWWKIGRKLHLAKPISWKSAGGRSPFVAEEYGGTGSEDFAAPARIEISPPDLTTGHASFVEKTDYASLVEKTGYASLIEYATRRFLEECLTFCADVIFDVGANTGQFAQGVRECGYRGQLVSFEPLSAAHAELVKAAANDPLWDIVDRCAVGAEVGDAEIHIAGNSYSSSLFPMLDRHKEAAPESAYSGVEACRVITLDDYIDATFSDATTTFGLKIDTQGYEAQVLAGSKRNIERISVVLCEMSLAPLYEGGPTISELSHVLADLGYKCVALGPEFEDPRTGELLQVNGIFVRR